MGVKIGFPRTLFYFIYFPFWHAFFSGLGFEVVTSRPTNKLSLDLGVQEAVNDACLPIKLYHGHVAELKDKVDVLFLPRMVSVRKLDAETFCPKFLGLPDMIRNSIAGLPEIIDEKVDLARGFFPLWKLGLKIARRLGYKKDWHTWRAFVKAKAAQDKYIRNLAAGVPPQVAMETAVTGEPVRLPDVPVPDLNLAILGYPYLIYDSFVNIGLFEKLAQMGVRAWTVEMVPPHRLEVQGKNLSKHLFWHFSNRAVRAAFYYLNEKRVDGIIHVTAFGCGPDAMVDKLMELEAKNRGNVPYLTLSLDEHTGEAGVLTRVEAFTDMLRIRRREHESVVSHHG
ncbi:MAG: acyl-CoA dehydratase activase-related protein [Peptococcaceae bacterium]|jgi:predicted nucleotide-binding protein (sugar kinase/HSP70/actin superfamily)|nr:acyl-CoA dehydratase activase-related protein [Peptococcaceae bacterium]MDH7526380.1 acyl-CoA dehydratase activase-related protein [Peptococcaceae bacterium]